MNDYQTFLLIFVVEIENLLTYLDYPRDAILYLDPW